MLAVDVNDNASVSPLDALLVINALNLRTGRVLPVALQHDSGPSATDRVTNVAAFLGNVQAVGLSSPSIVKARIDRGPVVNLPVDGAGNFVADAAALGGIQDGIRRATFATEYGDRSVAYARVTLTLDTLSPQLTDPKVASADDTGYRSDDGITNVPNPLITLNTEASARLKLSLGSQVLFDEIATSTFAQRTGNLADGTYQIVLNEVKELGRAVGSLRTADQTETARFWADGGGTYTPPGHWNQIASQFADSKVLSVGENARLFAMLNVALGDAAIVSWYTKYAYELWRPITAIQNADRDDNDNTFVDAAWSPLLVTPPFPEYTSGHFGTQHVQRGGCGSLDVLLR